MRTFVAVVGFVALLIAGVLYYVNSANSIESIVQEPTEESVEEQQQTPTEKNMAPDEEMFQNPGVMPGVEKEMKNLKTQSRIKDSNKEETEVLGTLESKSTARNQVWVGTFQLVWNDFMNQLIKGPVQFVGTQPVLADELNKQSFSAENLSESAYYKKWGLASLNLKKEIEQGIATKFNETSDILDQFDWTPLPGKYFFYAMLKKDFEFVEPFIKTGPQPFRGSDTDVEYFEAESYAQKRSVWVLFYKNSNNFAVRLESTQNDHVYLYRTDNPGTLASLYQDMKQEILAYKGKNTLEEEDHFKAPLLNLDVTREFTEIMGKPISPNWIIAKALETIKFKMDEKGVKLKSEAGIMTLRMAKVGALPRYFNFDARYVVFLADKGKKPYFALLVEDAAALQ